MIDIKQRKTLETLLNELPQKLLIIDKQGRVIDSFGQAEHASFFDNAINQQLNDLFPTNVAETLEQQLKQAFATKKYTTFRYSSEPTSLGSVSDINDIQSRWFEATLKPINLAGHEYVLWQEKEVTQAHLEHIELKKQAETDELTKILNRRAFMLKLEHEFHNPNQQALSCLILDIDHFKEINDQVGHLSGDEVIKHVAQVCRSLIRDNDYIGRLGGEEFGVVLSQTSAIQAYEIAERIRHSIAKSSCQVDDYILSATVSIGIAELTPETTSVRELLVQADKAMYYSKQTGRNQVSIYYDNLPNIHTKTGLNVTIQRAS